MTDGTYEQIRAGLLASYDDAGARRRDQYQKPPWKLAERDQFLRSLRQEGCRTLLEIGAGTGQDSLFFAEHGLRVLGTDLSPAMVERCRAKGLDAIVLDFSRPSFPAGAPLTAPFDAVYAMNCLLHVPDAELPGVLAGIAGLLRPGGLFFLGVYGGDGEEGMFGDDDHQPKRFFSWRTDEQILGFAREHFQVVDFHPVRWDDSAHGFQSLTLRRPPPGQQEDLDGT
jgi:SAM-dependent methyltransferase